ncbi:hypothetical protein D3C80_1692380 [compost metagenome]
MNKPIIAIDVTISRNLQLMLKCPRSPVKPIREFRAIIKREVPIAFFIGSFNRKINAGISKKPPPAPNIPVTRPIAIP